MSKLVDQSIRALKIMSSTGKVDPRDVPAFLESVHRSLVAMAGGEETPTEAKVETPEAMDQKPRKRTKPVPTVPINEAITQDAVTCLICEKTYKSFRHHLWNIHKLRPAEYHKQFGLADDNPLVAPAILKKRKRHSAVKPTAPVVDNSVTDDKGRGPLAIIDFETTGLSPNEGARATEIAAVIWQEGRIVRHYQSLMNAGVRVPHFITNLTGITNDMVRRAPPAAKVMREVVDFVGDIPFVAHKASFDRRFWDAELALIGRVRKQAFACSMLAARRVYPNAPNHKLGTLAAFAKLPSTGKAHRAMADVEMTAHLLHNMEKTLVERFQIKNLSHAMLRAIQKAKISNIQSCLKKFI